MRGATLCYGHMRVVEPVQSHPIATKGMGRRASKYHRRGDVGMLTTAGSSSYSYSYPPFNIRNAPVSKKLASME